MCMGRATLFANCQWPDAAAMALVACRILLLMLLPVAVAYSEQTLRVGGGYSPVLSYAGEDGKPTGFFVEVMREATKRAGYRFEWTFHPAGVESALSSSAVQLWAAASPTEARRRLFHFTRPWWGHNYQLLIREGTETGAELQGKRLWIDRKGPPLPQPLPRLFPGATITAAEGSQAAVIALCRGEADAFLVHDESLEQLLLRRPAPCDGVALRSLAGPQELFTSLAIASPFAQQKANQAVRDAIDELVHDGTLAGIASRYPQVVRHSALLMLESERRTAAAQWTQLAAGSVAVLLLGALGAFWMLRSSGRHAEAALLSAQGAAAAKQDFLARISHEVRTPMNAVSGYLEMLKDTPLRADQRQFAEEIARANGGLLAMLNDVLDFSGMQHGNLRLVNREFSPAESIDEAIGVLQPQADSKNIDLVVRVHANVPNLLTGDADRLRQIIVNLLANAIKYTHYGYVRVECEYEDNDKDERGGTFSISIVDSGVGIAPDQLKSIFEPFTQAGPVGTQAREGAGLGLAISARLAQAMNGKITVASTVDVGSHFQLRVPAPRLPGAAESWIAPFRQQRARIVMLAKSGANQDVLEGYLEGAGLQVVHADSEAALLAAVENGRHSRDPEGLPVWGVGIQPQCLNSPLHELAGQLRTTRKGRDLAIVLLASLATLAQMDNEDKASVDCLLVPPFGARSLRELFGDRKQRTGNESASKRVLVVDDNAINRKVASALMEKLGYAVETAPHGLDAVVKTGQETFSLILMDCQMPVMDGYEATRNIRLREHGGRRTPIIAVTANSRAEGIDRCIEAGMDGFVCKPVTLESLRSAVTEVQT
jgi:signal transduction histidine kinase/CheY-like chemotaxis protein